MSKIELTFPKFSGVESGAKFLAQEFKSKPVYYLARETIQNSLDAWSEESKLAGKPAKIVFKLHTVGRDSLLCAEDIRNAYQQARKYWVSHESSFKEIWDAGLNALSKPLIRVLEVSDYNTYGLPGKDNEVGSRWHSLVKSVGVPNPNAIAGGCYGIGKMAPFACSDLRTVFYSTATENSKHAFQGVCRLATFEDDGIKYAPDGFIGYNSKNQSDEYLAVRDKMKVPENFRRTQQGTSVWCLGFVDDRNWDRTIICAAIDSFWMAIDKGHLQVEVFNGDTVKYTVSKENLSRVINALGDEARLANHSLRVYKDAENNKKGAIIVESTDKEEFYAKIGKVKLLLAYGEKQDSTNQCYQVRNNYMRIRSNRWQCPLDYTAILICDDKDGASYLRALEPPSHEDWLPGLLGPVLEAEAKKNLSSLEAWVRRNLAEHATQQGGNEIVESFSFDDECENPDKVPLDITEDDYDPFTSKKPTKNGDGTQPGFVPNIRPGPPGPKPGPDDTREHLNPSEYTVDGIFYYLRVLSVTSDNKAKVRLLPSAEFDEVKPISFSFTAVGSDGAVEPIEPESVTCRGEKIDLQGKSKSSFKILPQILERKPFDLELTVRSAADLRIGLRFSLPITNEPK